MLWVRWYFDGFEAFQQRRDAEAERGTPLRGILVAAALGLLGWLALYCLFLD